MENIKLLRDNQSQFALVLAIFAAWAYNGEGPISSPQSDLRSISGMWPNVEHFVLHSDLVTSGTLTDLNSLEENAMCWEQEIQAQNIRVFTFSTLSKLIIAGNLPWAI